MFTKYNIRVANGYTGTVCDFGQPRNDVFFDKNEYNRVRRSTRSKLRIDGLCVLIAPTFRGSNHLNPEDFDIQIDIKRLEKTLNAISDNHKILVRQHYAYKGDFNDDDIVVDVSSYDDMQELLCAADILITDYSSSIWDFSLTGKPCLLFVPDLEQYKNKRGFFTPIEKWPGLICKDNDALLRAFTSLDLEAHKQKANRHLLEFGSYENGDASKKVVELIDAIAKRRKNEQE